MIPKRERKPSVFSFDGFPNIKLLDQCSIKPPLASDGQSQDLQHQENRHHQKQASEQIQSASTNESMAIKTSTPINNVDDIKATPILQPKSIRQDILGSNGSSRASSCDEPTIALNSTSSSITASPNSILSSASSSASSKENLVNQQGINFIVDDREEMTATDTTLNGALKELTGSQMTLSALSDSESLSSSPDSINVCSKNAASELAIINVDNGTAITNDSSKITPPTTPTLVAPFESIKTQIKRNSIPNAQLVKRHIDNLISQNTAIVDNWNLVSIRSYTSSSRQDQQQINNTSSSSPPAVSASSLSLTTATKPTTTTIITDVSNQIDFTGREQQQSNAISSNGASKEKLLSLPLKSSTTTTHLLNPGNNNNNNKRPKRWSTAMMSQNQLATLKAESSSNFGYSKALNNCNYINNNNDTNNIGDNNYLATSSNLCDIKQNRFSTIDDKSQQLQQATSIRLKQSERKRSYNLARLSSPPTSYTCDSLYAFGSHFNSPLITPCSSTQSLGAANLTSSNNPSMSTSPSVAQQQHHRLHHHNQQQQQQANNWSFSDQVQGIMGKLQFNTPNNQSEQQYHDPLYIENGIQNLSLRRRDSNSAEQHQLHLNPHPSISDEQLINSQPLMFGYHHHSAQIDLQQNLIAPPIDQYYQQLQQTQQSSHDQVVMAALMMERHRQSLITAELQRQQLQKDIENQAAIIRQKQMIEQQLDLQIALSQQLAASLEQYKQSDQQYRHPIVLADIATTTSSTTNNSDANFDATNQDSSLETNNAPETTIVGQSSLTSELSILKQQLLDTQQANIQTIQLPVPHESLPFKKRKISEPNMRYQ